MIEALLGLAGIRKRRRIADWLPWELMLSKDLDPNGDVIGTRSGGLLRVAEIVPRDIGAAGKFNIKAYFDRIGAIVGGYGQGWSIYFDQWRLRDRSYLPESDFGGCLAAKLVDDSCRRMFEGDDFFPSHSARTFVAVHLLPQASNAVRSWLGGGSAAGLRSQAPWFLEHSESLFQAFAHEMPGVSIKRGDGLASYLESTVSFRPGFVEMPSRGKLYNQLGTQGWFTVEDDKPLENVVRIGEDLYLATMEVINFGATTPYTSWPLQRLPYPSRFTTTIHCLSREARLLEIHELRRRWKAVLNSISFTGKKEKDQRALQALDELDRLEREFDHRVFCRATSNIYVWGKTKDEACERAGEVAGLVRGPKVAQARLNSFLAPVADMPGNVTGICANVRRNRNIEIGSALRFAPILGVNTGSRQDDHYKAPALIVGRSHDGSQFFMPLNPPGSDKGHSFIVAPSGCGKSFIMGRKASHFLRYDKESAGADSRLAFIDRKRSYRINCLLHGGAWIELGPDKPGVQPLRFIHDPREREFAHGWYLNALELEGVSKKDNPGLGADLKEAMEGLIDLDPDQRTTSALWANMAGSGLAREALSIYRDVGPYGKMFDGPVQGYHSSRALGIETYGIEESKARALVIAGLGHAIKRDVMTGKQPTLILWDEASFVLDDPLWGKWAAEFVLEGRKDNASVILATQSLEHMRGPKAKAIMEQAANVLYGPDPNIGDPTIAQVYWERGLTPELTEVLARAVPKRDWLLRSGGGDYKLVGFPTMGDALLICGSNTQADHARMDDLLARGFAPGEELLAEWKRETTAEWKAGRERSMRVAA